MGVPHKLSDKDRWVWNIDDAETDDEGDESIEEGIERCRRGMREAWISMCETYHAIAGNPFPQLMPPMQNQALRRFMEILEKLHEELTELVQRRDQWQQN